MKGHIRKVGPETREFWWDPRPGTHFWVRPGTLKVESETQDRYFTWELRPGTKRLKEGSGTLTKGETKTQSKHLLSNLERKN